MNCNIPELVTLEKYNGDVNRFIDGLYAIFEEDFIIKKITYQAQTLALKKYPSDDGKYNTFWHIISSGQTEADKTPDMARCGRIKWAAYILRNCVTSQCNDLKIWENERKNKKRICILCNEHRYLIILEKRESYILFWTAYHIEYEHSLNKLLKEYSEYIKAKAAEF